MPISCPQCKKQLPQVDTLEYRFCPHCGAEIAAKSGKLDNTLQTIPPDLPPPQPKQAPPASSPQTSKQAIPTEPTNDRTIEPQPLSKHKPPEIKPPDTAPPSSFFRSSSAEQTFPERNGDFIERPPAKNRSKLIIAALILLVVIILILGGLFTF